MNAILRISFRLLILVILLASLTLASPARGQTISDPAAVPLMTRDGIINLQPSDGRMYAAVVDVRHNYAYFGTYSQPAKIFKINLTSFTLEGSLTLLADEGVINAGVIDSSGTYAYFGTSTMMYGSTKIVKLRLSDLTRVSALPLGAGEKSVTSAVLDPGGEYAYFGVYCDPGPGKIIKVRLADFTRVGTITLLDSKNSPGPAVAFEGYAYFGAHSVGDYGVIMRVCLSDFADEGGYSYPYEGLRSAGTNLHTRTIYFGSILSRMYKIRPDGFKIDYYLTLPSGSGGIYATIIDGLRGYAYLGTDTGKVVQVRLVDLASMSTLVLDPLNEGAVDSAVVDEFKGYAYLALGTDKILRLKIGEPVTLDYRSYQPLISR